MESLEEIHRHLSRIRNALAQAAQASGVMRAVPEALRLCLQQLSERAQACCTQHGRDGSEPEAAAALDALEELVERACTLSAEGEGDAPRLLAGLEEARHDIRDLRRLLAPPPAADVA